MILNEEEILMEIVRLIYLQAIHSLFRIGVSDCEPIFWQSKWLESLVPEIRLIDTIRSYHSKKRFFFHLLLEFCQ